MALKPNLVNAVQTAEEYTLRKCIPNYQQIDELVPEDYVKLKSNGEYFWVKVDEIDDPYIGIILNDPVFPQIFEKGERIEFECEHVFDIRSYEWKTNEGI